MTDPCYWKNGHGAAAPTFPCYVDREPVCARCCVEHCRTEEPDTFATCQAAGHPTWPTGCHAPRRLIAVEGYWDDESVFDRTSVGPFLQGLTGLVPGLQIVFRRADTVTELRRLLKTVIPKDQGACDTPVYYFAFHGAPGELDLGHRRGISTEQLGACFADHPEGARLLYFSSCSTFAEEAGEQRADALLRASKSRAVVGYREEVDWADSMLIDLRFLHAFFNHSDPWSDLRGIERDVRTNFLITRKLGWMMHTA